MARESGLALLWDNTPCRAAGHFHANVAAPSSQIRQEFRVAAGCTKATWPRALWAQSTDSCQTTPVSPKLLSLSARQRLLILMGITYPYPAFHHATSQTLLHSLPIKITTISRHEHSGYPWAERREYWLARSKREHCKALEMFETLILVIGEYIRKNSLTCKLKTSTLFCKYRTPHFKNLLMKKTVISDQHFLFCRALYTVTLLFPSMLHAPLPSALHHSSASGD